MYKTILCAIECSTEGRKILTKTLKMAEKLGSNVLVISVLPYTFLPKDYQKELKNKSIPDFEKITNDFGISKKNRMLKVGKPYEVICDEAKKKKADLIILGTHSKKGIPSLMGSTATGVANHAKCDVSLIRL